MTVRNEPGVEAMVAVSGCRCSSPAQMGNPSSRLAGPPRASRPQPELVEIEIGGGGRVVGEQLADEQPADDRDPEPAAEFSTLAKPDRERHRPEYRRHC